MKRLNRKQLPGFQKINKKVDIARLQTYCKSNGYTNYDNFNDIKYSGNSKIKPFLVANTYCKNAFFKEDDAAPLEGEKYKQIYLTELDPKFNINSETKLDQTHGNIFMRTKRLNVQSKKYIAEADEYNYTHKNSHVRDIFEEILNGFKSPVTRVRLAVIFPNFTIKPHVDYDPTYITRYHIPIFTNEKVTFGYKDKLGIHEYKMPADGNIYFFNSGLVHWVSNLGTEPRLHLIIDTNGQDDLIF